MANSKKHIVYAPPPTDPSLEPSIYWIEVPGDQAVEWQWTRLPDGNGVVTGYKLIEKAEPEGAASGGGAPET
jgi:hypothetical protein